mmetsp:Transcript_7037/g.22250  ORF Transcript_7037/g.22250 Transcript_7037/m.22250 type:complete len:217 (+) Transcript_7037:3004-3654(+)
MGSWVMNWFRWSNEKPMSEHLKSAFAFSVLSFEAAPLRRLSISWDRATASMRGSMALHQFHLATSSSVVGMYSPCAWILRQCSVMRWRSLTMSASSCPSMTYLYALGLVSRFFRSSATMDHSTLTKPFLWSQRTSRKSSSSPILRTGRFTRWKARYCLRKDCAASRAADLPASVVMVETAHIFQNSLRTYRRTRGSLAISRERYIVTASSTASGVW